MLNMKKFLATNTAGNNPFTGYYAGYHAMFDKIALDLPTLGFAFERVITGGDYDQWDIIWEAGSRYSSQDENPGILQDAKGWDFTAFEWWLMPTGMLWVDGVMLAEAIYPTGYNVFPYLNEFSDELYWKMQSTFDAEDRRDFAYAWQKEQMHDPVCSVVYYPASHDILSSYVEGYYGTVWWYDIRNLALDQTLIDTLYPGYMSEVEYNRLKNGTLKYAITEDWWAYNPMFVDTYTEETFANIIADTLYGMSLSVWPPPETAADPTKYITAPSLAEGQPKYPVDNTHAIINLKTGITWSDGEAFDADDVVWSLNAHLDPLAKTTARGDFAPIVSAVNKVNASAVELGWGLSMMPEHYFSGQLGLTYQDLKGHVSNSVWTEYVKAPTIGAYNLTAVTASTLTFEKNPAYWGYGAPYNYGPHGIDKIILVQIKAASARWDSILAHEVDFGEYPTKDVAAFPPLYDRPDLDIFIAQSPASHGVWYNFDNPYLSNRYVRLAISHAINYTYINTAITPSWGVTASVQGRSPNVMPIQYYEYGGTLVNLFDFSLVPYTMNMTRALQYLDCWKLSRIAHAPNDMSGGNWSAGALADADFSGVVNLDDFTAWASQWGRSEADFSWDGAYECLPGQDIDSDFNNDNIVNTDDLNPHWYDRYGWEYPYEGAY